MILGLILLVSAGLMWCAFGILISFSVKKSINFYAVVAVQSVLSAIGGWIFVSDYRLLLTENFPRFGELSIIMLISGLICSLGIFIMHFAMQSGHHGIVYTISQSSLMIPFIVSVFIFNELLSPVKLAGIVLVLMSFAAFGFSQVSRNSGDKKRWNKNWFIIAVSAFLLLGFHQSLTIIPSYWENWSDTENFRATLLLSGISLGYISFMVIRKISLDLKSIWIGILLLPIGLPSQVVFYKGMDLLAKENLISLVYPLAVGTNIVSFSMYSLFLKKERGTPLSISGIVLGLIGLVLIST